MLNALKELGQDVESFKKEKAPDPQKSFFRYDLKNFTLDFLPVLKTRLKFRPSFQKRDIIRLKEIEISFIGYDDLLVDKQGNARPKDLVDIEKLKATRKKKNLE